MIIKVLIEILVRNYCPMNINIMMKGLTGNGTMYRPTALVQWNYYAIKDLLIYAL